MYRPAVHSFALVGLLGTVVFQAKPPVILRPVQKDKLGISKQTLELMAKQAEANKSEYLRANEDARQAWTKLEPEARATLEKAGLKVEDVQKQSQNLIADIAKEDQALSGRTVRGGTSRAGTLLKQLSDTVGARLSGTNPAWLARTNSEFRRRVGSHLWFQPEIQAVQTPVAVNTNGLVTRTYTPPYSWCWDRYDTFGALEASVSYTNVGAEYQIHSITQDLLTPRGVRHIHLSAPGINGRTYLDNIVTWGYGSAECKITLKLIYNGERTVASVSHSFGRSIFVCAGGTQETHDVSVGLDLDYDVPASEIYSYHAELDIEAWAGGGPLGSRGTAGAQLRVPSLVLTCTS